MLIVMMRWRSHPRRQAATVETGRSGGRPKSAGLQASQMPTAEILDFVESPSSCAVFLRLGQRNEGI
jgi:hypothetical protein